jgi:hypothetical protein
MRHRHTDRQETFSPLRDKTLANILRQQFVDEFGYGNKIVFAEVMIERILETIESFLKPASLLRPGQLLWMAVAHDGHKHAMQPMKVIPQVPVVLDLIVDAELGMLANGKAFHAVRQQRHARLLKQALAQGGVLAQSDLAAISLRHHRTIHEDIQYVQRETGCLLPYRGSVQDIGATLTHKVQVARMLEAGWLEPDIARKLSPTHSLRAVERYAQTYKNVLKLLERGFAPNEISSILRIGPRVVDAYIDIVNEHHPQIVARNPHLQESLDTSTNP